MKLRLAALLLIPVSGVTFASGDAASYVSVLGSYLRADYPGSYRSGYGATLLYGLPIGHGLDLEFTGFSNYIDKKTPGSDVISGIGADIRLPLSDGKLAPFVIGGIGANVDYVAKTTHFAPYADVGVGVIARLTQHLGLRAEARYYPVFNVDKGPGESRVINDARFNLGLQYSFGTVVATNRASAATPVVAAAEPATPAPEAPAELTPSASVDSDGDGVPDAKDRCPDTPKGLKVDASGCIIEQTVVLRAVNFDLGSDRLSDEAKATLDLLARSMQLQKALAIEIAGHTDALGPQSFNLLLSQKRAAAVKAYLVAHGVEASRLQSEGYGEFNPIASNNTEAGRAENRRVEFKVLSKPAK
ncbi:MAG: hypothetical protein NVS9B10_10470 [Nevskia sp.]